MRKWVVRLFAVLMIAGPTVAIAMAAVCGFGVPYPDGPNQGYATEPGIGRTLEPFAGPVFLIGMAVGLVSITVLAMTSVRKRPRKGY